MPGVPMGRAEMSWLCASLLWVRLESSAAAAGTLPVCFGSAGAFHPFLPTLLPWLSSLPTRVLPSSCPVPIDHSPVQAPLSMAGTALSCSPVLHLRVVVAEPSQGGQGTSCCSSSTQHLCGIYRRQNIIPLPKYYGNRLSVCHRREDFNGTVFTAGVKVMLPRCFPCPINPSHAGDGMAALGLHWGKSCMWAPQPAGTGTCCLAHLACLPAGAARAQGWG